jgi:hypothetical protein
LVLYYTPPGCLKIVDAHTDRRLPQKPKFISDMMPLSNLGWILPTASPSADPPEGIFGPEPEQGWCYYFERAELARQAGDWEQVAVLADQGLALDHKLYEVNAAELVTYIEGYAHTGQWDRAAQLTNRAMSLSKRMDRMLCDAWERISGLEVNVTQRDEALASVSKLINCTLP